MQSLRLNKIKLNLVTNICRKLSCKPAVVVGCLKDKECLHLTENGEKINQSVHGKLAELLEVSKFKGDSGKVRNFYGLHEDYPHIVVTGLGEKNIPFNENEDFDENKENVRIGIGSAVKSLCKDEVESCLIDHCEQPAAAAEGALLSSRQFDAYKSKKVNSISINMFNLEATNENVKSEWEYGMITADSQNFAANLMEAPGNKLYPALFAEAIQNRFSQSPDIQVKVRDLDWIKEKKMNCLLSVGKGSINESRFVEVHYMNGGNDEKPIVLVGKGVTFDSGGISIKPSNGMALMKGDMGGAACVLSTVDAVDKLKLPLNIVVLVPLAENMPSGRAVKPGDVETAMNGRTVEVDNTDAEGRLILADALCYSEEFQPRYLFDVATLTGAIVVALGCASSAVYSTSTPLWEQIHQAGITSGDRVWRMPIYSSYTEQMKKSRTADLKNISHSPRDAGANTAAAFLKEFVSTNNWAHLDIAGVMENKGDLPYLPIGMTGRPTRTLVETMRRFASS